MIEQSKCSFRILLNYAKYLQKHYRNNLFFGGGYLVFTIFDHNQGQKWRTFFTGVPDGQVMVPPYEGTDDLISIFIRDSNPRSSVQYAAHLTTKPLHRRNEMIKTIFLLLTTFTDLYKQHFLYLCTHKHIILLAPLSELEVS